MTPEDDQPAQRWPSPEEVRAALLRQISAGVQQTSEEYWADCKTLAQAYIDEHGDEV